MVTGNSTTGPAHVRAPRVGARVTRTSPDSAAAVPRTPRVTRTRAIRTPRAIRSLLTALIAVLAVVPLTLAPPAAQAVQYNATIAFTGVLTTDAGVTLTGIVENTGTDPLHQVEVVLWGGTPAITTAQALDAVLASDPQSETADALTTPGATAVIVAGDVAFAAGQTAAFTVTATWADLGAMGPGAYLTGVYVHASDVPEAPLVTIGWGRTLVTHSAFPAASALVVLMTSAPAWLHDAVFLDDHLAGELAGRLLTLVQFAGRPGVTWVIDPALLRAVTVMAGGYEVAQGTTTTPGTGQAAATTWLDAFRLLDMANGYRLPWGNPDLALGLAHHDPALLTNAQAAAAADPALDPLPLAVRAANGRVDDAFLTYIAPLAPAAVLAETMSSAVAGSTAVLATPPEPFPAGLTTGDDAGLQTIQRALADNWIAPGPLVRVVDTVAAAGLAGRLLLRGVPIVPLRDITVTTPWSPALARGTPAGPLTAAALTPVASVGTVTDAYASLVADPAAADALVAAQRSLMLSQSWPGDAAAGTYATAVAAWVRTLMAGVTLTAPADVSLTARVTSFPVTITNTLTVPVSVRITGRSTPTGIRPANITIPAVDTQVVEPGVKMTLVMSPTVLREGDADLRLQLTTPSGVAIGTPVVLPVHAAITAWMGWAVVGAAFVLFAVGTYLRVRTKGRSRSPVEQANVQKPVEQVAVQKPVEQASAASGVETSDPRRLPGVSTPTRGERSTNVFVLPSPRTVLTNEVRSTPAPDGALVNRLVDAEDSA